MVTAQLSKSCVSGFNSHRGAEYSPEAGETTQIQTPSGLPLFWQPGGRSVAGLCSCDERDGSLLHSTPLTFLLMKVYVDAARGEFVSGVGYVLEGEVNASGRRVLDDTYTSMEAEFLALSEGLRIASQRSQSNEYCEAYSDCRPLVDKMRGDERRSDEWDEYHATFEWLSGKFDEFELNHCSREDNEDAHQLAREALFAGRSG